MTENIVKLPKIPHNINEDYQSIVTLKKPKKQQVVAAHPAPEKYRQKYHEIQPSIDGTERDQNEIIDSTSFDEKVITPQDIQHVQQKQESQQKRKTLIKN